MHVACMLLFITNSYYYDSDNKRANFHIVLVINNGVALGNLQPVY